MVQFLIMSCGRDRHNGCNSACYNTWVGLWRPRYAFVLGKENIVPFHDELIVDAPDDYGALQLKQRAAYEWALSKDVTYAFISFTDTYVAVTRLIQESEFVESDLLGLKVRHGGNHASGGAGYWLSRRAMEAILATPIKTDCQGDEADWEACARAGLAINYDERFGSYFTRHLSKNTGNYDPLWMYDTHAAYRKGEW